ncbi:MAG: hypothetical protein JWN09_2235, partial [Microbacteriaceae bacterium]|nr:hypothetical protein [Microbacteriaceae bacterium]
QLLLAATSESEDEHDTYGNDSPSKTAVRAHLEPLG